MEAGDQQLVHTPFVPSGYWSPCAPLVLNPVKAPDICFSSSHFRLSVCLPSQISTFDQHSATIYSVTGVSQNPFSEYEENLSCKISKRFHCPVFVSISLPHEFASQWNHVNVITQSTLGQKAEYCIFENLSTIVLS
ncbi:unnamed protein product [Schistosoma margrebowiei]|uniref:Uncharacterized protein n=1 Tax=Schistosoma margrebowiei TaxID=48269 RepID=A0A183MJH3_9TREM|nr:unnamed protein product [Schistosoma margrebowiei]